MGRQTTVGIVNINFQGFRCYVFGTFGNEANVITVDTCFSLSSPFHRPGPK